MVGITNNLLNTASIYPGKQIHKTLHFVRKNVGVKILYGKFEIDLKKVKEDEPMRIFVKADLYI